MRTTRSGESALLLLDVIDLLSAQNVEYAVVGALAASIHRAVRASMDADVVLSVGVHQAENIGQSVKSLVPDLGAMEMTGVIHLLSGGFQVSDLC